MPTTRVLVATDGSDLSIEAACRAGELLPPGGAITVLSVASPHEALVVAPNAAAYVPQAVDPGAARAAAVEEAERSIERTIEAARLGEVDRRVTVGTAGAEICHVAAEGEFDVIVVGSHGYGALKRALLGSVSQHVVHHAPCPVLVVRHQDGAG